MRRPKTGCLTCRIRKIKCDEAKPSCLKCTSTGRTCDGYSTLPFSRNDLVAASRSSASPPGEGASSESSSYLVPRLMTSDAFRTVAEKRYFQFFRHCTVASTNLTVDSRFWDRLIVQACDAEAAIKHAVLTIASHHNAVITRNNKDVSEQHAAYAEKQYQLAIAEAKQLITVPSTQQIDRILMVCILFIVFENLRGNYAASRKHMDSGRSIAAQYWSAEQSTSQKKRSGEIAEVFARLDLFALSFSDAAAVYQYTLDDLLRTSPDLQPRKFESIHEAHVSLMDLVRWLLVTGDQMIFKSDPLDPMMTYYEAEISKCRQCLHEWQGHWDELLTASESKDTVDTKTVELWYHKAVALAESGFVGPESRYDRSIAQFERIVQLSEDISSAIRQRGEDSDYSLDIGYLPVAFFAAIRCRDPSLRRRAIAVLESHSRREGMWESTAAGAIARRWMQLEEDGLGEVGSASQVPESKRIAVLDLAVDSASSSASLRFTSSASELSAVRAYRDEELCWS